MVVDRIKGQGARCKKPSPQDLRASRTNSAVPLHLTTEEKTECETYSAVNWELGQPTEQAYPSSRWALISKIREYGRNHLGLDFLGPFGDFHPISEILLSAEMLLYEYTSCRAPHLKRITRRIGAVPYTFRVTLFMLPTLCSKLRRPHVAGYEAQLERIIDAFVGDPETQRALRTVLEKASSYRPFRGVPPMQRSTRSPFTSQNGPKSPINQP
ncbi:hypothetical protein FA13DRAFT_1740977 [Coprinellus micaceus]|uniref:Uncharacterized protein n=1 Tax=Coprinellus micaceus TaxID=71717 RepID=A0A4Y7SL44_COPMI|nr:hypothetical protein FA13DRAFT_1740977 [Coprinellus micaceus]